MSLPLVPIVQPRIQVLATRPVGGTEVLDATS